MAGEPAAESREPAGGCRVSDKFRSIALGGPTPFGGKWYRADDVDAHLSDVHEAHPKYKPPTSTLQFLQHREAQCWAELRSIAERRAKLRKEAMEQAGEWVCDGCLQPWRVAGHSGCSGPVAS